jgi:hypothetical protein
VGNPHEDEVSFLDHAKWNEVLPHLYVQTGGGVNGPRHRIEATDEALKFVDIKTACVGCGRTHYPIKRRARWGTIYFSVTCSFGDKRSMQCRNGQAARTEADAIRAAIHGQPSEPNLFS